MKRLAIVIPVKSLQEGKSRLDGALSAQDRYQLNAQLLSHTLDCVARLRDLAEVYVVSKSAEVLAHARRRGFEAYAEPGDCELNDAVAFGTLQAEAAGATEVMALPIDLPWLSVGQLRSAVDNFRARWDVMIVTDRAQDGTNLLLWRPIATARFQYGTGSAARHAATAEALGLRVCVRQDAWLSFDLDTPEDLSWWLRDRNASQPDDAGSVRLVS